MEAVSTYLSYLDSVWNAIQFLRLNRQASCLANDGMFSKGGGSRTAIGPITFLSDGVTDPLDGNVKVASGAITPVGKL
jgi:hypothetical protein